MTPAARDGEVARIGAELTAVDEHPVFITDHADFSIFVDAGYFYEYLPPIADQVQHASGPGMGGLSGSQGAADPGEVAAGAHDRVRLPDRGLHSADRRGAPLAGRVAAIAGQKRRSSIRIPPSPDPASKFERGASIPLRRMGSRSHFSLIVTPPPRTARELIDHRQKGRTAVEKVPEPFGMRTVATLREIEGNPREIVARAVVGVEE